MQEYNSVKFWYMYLFGLGLLLGSICSIGLGMTAYEVLIHYKVTIVCVVLGYTTGVFSFYRWEKLDWIKGDLVVLQYMELISLVLSGTLLSLGLLLRLSVKFNISLYLLSLGSGLIVAVYLYFIVDKVNCWEI